MARLAWVALIAGIVSIFLQAVAIISVQSLANEQLGFDYATPQNSWHEETFVITRVAPDGPFARAGIQVEDEVQLDDVSTLYALLLEHQGGFARIPMRRNGRPRVARVAVPPLRLPFSPALRKWLYRGPLHAAASIHA